VCFCNIWGGELFLGHEFKREKGWIEGSHYERLKKRGGKGKASVNYQAKITKHGNKSDKIRYGKINEVP